MDNITHSLLGATLAELALPSGASRVQRRSFFVAGILAANLPDADLVYTAITPGPLGYLLHHRGHTHTLVGLVGQALLIGAVCWLPAVRRNLGSLRTRFAALIAVGLLSHLALDSWNSYGVHPFWPWDPAWYYGDAIFILEPWIWLMLGVAVVLNTRNGRGRVALGTVLVLLVVVPAALGMLPLGALAALSIGGAAMIALHRRWSPTRRSAIALGAGLAFVGAMFGVRERVVRLALASPPPGTARLVDMILSPEPGNPLCWSALTVGVDRAADAYVMSHGAIAASSIARCGASGTSSVAWAGVVTQSLSGLRELVRRDCAVRAWMQFGRAPEVSAGTISDLRYGRTGRENFSAMPVRSPPEAAACPRNLTRWGMPRADLLAP